MQRLGDLGRQLSPSDVRALFPGAWWHEVFEYQQDKVPIRFVDEGLAIDGGLDAGTGPWNLIVHGDLHATGDLDFATGDYKTSLLVVLGGVRARNFRFTNGATCAVAQDLVATDYVLGRYGDESARLEVGGTLRARALLLDHVTGVDADLLDTIVCTVEGWGLPIDLDYYADNRAVFAATVLDREDHTLDLGRAWEVASSGGEVLRPDAEARLRAAVAKTPRRLDRS